VILVKKTDPISLEILDTMAQKMYGHLVKAVVDIEQKIMFVDADFHADEEQVLLEDYASQQKDLWGINFHPSKRGTPDFIEFDSMINLRPSMGNKTRGVDDLKIQAIIREIVDMLVVS